MSGQSFVIKLHSAAHLLQYTDQELRLLFVSVKFCVCVGSDGLPLRWLRLSSTLCLMTLWSEVEGVD